MDPRHAAPADAPTGASADDRARAAPLAALTKLRRSWRERGPFARRATAFLLALVVHALLLVMLFTLAPPQSRRPEVLTQPVTFRLLPPSDLGPQPKPAPRARLARTKHSSGGGARAPRAPTTAAAPAAPRPTTNGPLNMMVVSKDVFDGANIAALPSHHGEAKPDAGDGDSAGRDTGSDEGVGTGPGGERLYNAEWYVKPTHAEMATYLPSGATQSGWGMIACRTVPNYRVEDCHELGDSPPGSGLARALRQASWQFRVRPPRIGGRPLVGAWVRIRFDFTLETK